MTPTPSPLRQLALSATLCGPIARHFALRPSLRDVATHIIEQQWREREIAGPAPERLTLYRWITDVGYRLDALPDVLIERFCQPAPIRMVNGKCFLSLDQGAEFPWTAETDAHAVETLLNECGPLLIEEYKRQLVSWWGCSEDGQADAVAWLAAYLQDGCRDAARLEQNNGTLDSLEAATVLSLAEFPEAAQRAALKNLAGTAASLLSMEVLARHQLDPELASVLLIRREVPEQNRSLVMLYTLAGRLLRFDTPQALLFWLVRRGGQTGHLPFHLHLFNPEESLFWMQALQVFEQQLVLVDTVARAVQQRQVAKPGELALQVDAATSFLQICEQNQYQTWRLYYSQLPDWLREASYQERTAFGNDLIGLARSQERSDGLSFLHGLLPIAEYARQQLHSAVIADHPQATAAVIDAVEIINKRVVSGAIGGGGSVAVGGSIETVHLSLAEFALENLSALKAGSVSLAMRDGSPLPAWLTLAYVKALVTRLDLGACYPQLLREELLDGPQVSTRRLPVFVEQVRQQLPLLALERKLRGLDGLTAAGVRLVNGVFRPVPGEPDFARLRPLALIRRPGATADAALNTWLITGFDLHRGPCVLYRPLHRRPLREFSGWDAFFDALCDEQPLQDDVLARLDPQARPVYAKGGLEQPHIVRFVPGAEFGLIETPAPARLAEAQISGNVLEQLYHACATELVTRAESQSVSNSENRWLELQELGWLMFNTLLPLLNGPVALSSWMLQFFSLLRNDLLPADREQGQLVASLFNLALLLITFPGIQRSERPVGSTPEAPTGPLPTVQVARRPTSSPSGAALSQLDFSWASAGQRLSAAQRQVLSHFSVKRTPEQLGAPLSKGPGRGLYQHEGNWWARVEDELYQLTRVDDEWRVVDGTGQLGPWLHETSPGTWQFSTELRLRGGMPLNRRIEQLRAANRARITDLENRHVELLGQRVALNVLLEDDLEGTAGVDKPSAELLTRYGNRLRLHEQLLRDLDENFIALNQLKSQPHFNYEHARMLLERATSHEQLLYVLRTQLLDSKLRIRELQQSIEAARGDTATQQQHYQVLMTSCEGAKAIIDEAIGSYERARELLQQLQQVLPMGPGMAERVRGLHNNAPSIWAWRSSEFNMAAILILGAEQTDGAELYEAVKTTRIALQMQLELEAEGDFTAAERVEVLDGAVSKYAEALQTLADVEPTLGSPRGQLWFAAMVSSLKRTKSEAEDGLASLIRTLPSEAKPAPPPAERKQVVINTRRRGVVVARQRKSKSGRVDTVVVDPLENSELARFEESAEPGVWQMVEPESPTRPASAGVSLGSLLERSVRLKAESERQMARARSQAKTATIGVEMEEILINQARPLERLSLQIEEHLSQSNEVDSQEGGRDAALEAKALFDQAQAMRSEGRRLRVLVTKAQLPTAARVAWLKAQCEVVITRPKGREPSAKRKGKPQDYLQEYVISDTAGQPLWYAHFHYATADAAAEAFSAAHLKTRGQRFDGGQHQLRTEKNSQKVIEIYRSRIDKAMARELFLAV